MFGKSNPQRTTENKDSIDNEPVSLKQSDIRSVTKRTGIPSVPSYVPYADTNVYHKMPFQGYNNAAYSQDVNFYANSDSAKL